MKMLNRISLLCTVLIFSGSIDAFADSDTAYIPNVETFLQIGALGSPRISDNGKDVFFTANMSGVNQLYHLMEDGWPYQLSFYPDGVDYYALAPDGRSVVVGASVGGDEQSQLIWLDGYTGRPKNLTDLPDVQFGSLMFGRDAGTIFYRSNQANGKDFYVYQMSVPAGEARVVYEAAGYNLPGAVSHDGRWLVILYYESNENSDLYLVDLQGSDSPRHLTPHDGPVVYAAGDFSADDTKLYFFSNDNDEGASRPLVMDLSSGRISDMLDSPSRWEAEGGGMSPDGQFAGIIYNEDGYGRLHIYEVATMKELAVPDLNGIVSSIRFSNSGTAVISFSSPTEAPNAWLWNLRTETLTQLTHTSYAGIDPGLFRDPELVRILSDDGLEVPAFLYLPSSHTPGTPIPFIVNIHGGPESQFRPYFIRNFQYMMLNGYGILAPNVRGSSGYGRTYQSLDNYKNRMKSVADAGACARWLVDEGYTTTEMMGVRGGSYGGFMVLACITEYPDMFSAAVDNVGIANFQTFLENTKPYRRHLREAEYGPLSDPEFLASVSPIHKVDRIKTPLLVIHGENDPRVPVSEARQIAAAITARGGIVDTLIFPDEGHGTSKRANVLKSYRMQVDFFDTHLKKKSR